jgi:DNA-directed RNA polymerase specialized sigma24 family protein
MTAGQGDEATSAPPATELVENAAAGDSRAWDRLVDTYEQLIWAITREFEPVEGDAADVTQVTWLRLPEHTERPGRPARVSSRLGTTAQRECPSSAAAHKKVVLAQDGAARGGCPAGGPEFDERLLAAGHAQSVRDALSRLSPGWQQLLELLLANPSASDSGHPGS